NLSEMARIFGVTNHQSVGNVLRQMGFQMPGRGCRPLKALCIDCKVARPRILAHKLTKGGTGTRCHECLKKYKRLARSGCDVGTRLDPSTRKEKSNGYAREGHYSERRNGHSAQPRNLGAGSPHRGRLCGPNVRAYERHHRRSRYPAGRKCGVQCGRQAAQDRGDAVSVRNAERRQDGSHPHAGADERSGLITARLMNVAGFAAMSASNGNAGSTPARWPRFGKGREGSNPSTRGKNSRPDGSGGLTAGKDRQRT